MADTTEMLLALREVVQPHDRPEAVRAVNAWAAGDLVQTHTLVIGISWGYWLSDETPPDMLHPLLDDLAARRRAARGAIGRPHDFVPPSRYGHLQG